MSHSIRISLVTAVAGLLTACGGEIGGLAGSNDPAPSGMGRVQMDLTATQVNGGGSLVAGQPTVAGPSGQVQHINVTISKVTAHSASAGWVQLFSGPPLTIDLLDLKNDLVTLGFGNLPAGKVTQIRLYTTEGATQNVGLKDGTTVALKVPSGVQSGIKVHGPFEVSACNKVTLTLGFVGHKSIWVHPTGQGDLWILRPVIHSHQSDAQPIGCTPGGGTGGGNGTTGGGGGNGSIIGGGGGSSGTTGGGTGGGSGFPEIPGGGGGGSGTTGGGTGGSNGTIDGTGGSGSTGGTGGSNGTIGGAGGGSGSTTPGTPILTETGGACSLSSQCMSGACINGVCGAGASGSPCLSAIGCASGVCSNGSCAPPANAGSTGSACSTASQCLSASCINGVCDPGATGQPCRASTDCTNGLSCISGSCVVPIN